MIGSADTHDLDPGLADKFWNADTVATVIAAKAEKRNVKDKPVNIFVLQVMNPTTNEREVETFVNNLKESIDKGNFADGDRFQVAAQCGAHWTPFDITIRNGQMHVVSLDAVGDPSEMDTLRVFQKAFPTATYYGYQAASENAAIQFDNCSCSRFSLDMLFKLQNIDVVSELEAQAKIKAPRNITPARDKTKGPEYLLNPSDIPPSMAFIYRNTQSWTNINALPPTLQSSPIDKKSTTLIDYANAGSVQVDDKKSPPNADGSFKQKKVHQSIEKVKAKMSAYTNDFIIAHPDRTAILANRTGNHYITQDAAGRARLNDAQTSRFSDEQKMGALSSEFVRNNAVEERKGFFSKFKPETRTEKSVKIAKSVIQDVSNDAATPKTRENFGKILPAEKARLDEKGSAPRSSASSSSSSPPPLTSAYNASRSASSGLSAADAAKTPSEPEPKGKERVSPRK